MTGRHPVRLVVTDDLRRSRLTVGFRILLAIPHLIWAGLFGIVVLVVVFVNWWATLFRAESPRGLHDFLAGYLRYVTHVEAYIALAANPFPAFFTGSSLKPYPVDLEIDGPQRQSRWKTGFRLFLALPALLVAGALGGGNGGWGRSTGYGFSAGVLATASLLTWFAALVTGRAPRGLRDLSAWAVGYAAHTAAYLFLLTDRYPYAGPEGHLQGLEPAGGAEGRSRLIVRDDLRRSRLTVLFRLLLVLPHLVWLALWTVVAVVATFTNWLVALVTGRSPAALSRFLTAYLRYAIHVSAFLHLVGNPFPGFVGEQGSYPVDVEVARSERQSRWVTLFRLFSPCRRSSSRRRSAASSGWPHCSGGSRRLRRHGCPRVSATQAHMRFAIRHRRRPTRSFSPTAIRSAARLSRARCRPSQPGRGPRPRPCGRGRDARRATRPPAAHRRGRPSRRPRPRRARAGPPSGSPRFEHRRADRRPGRAHGRPPAACSRAIPSDASSTSRTRGRLFPHAARLNLRRGAFV